MHCLKITRNSFIKKERKERNLREIEDRVQKARYKLKHMYYINLIQKLSIYHVHRFRYLIYKTNKYL